MPRVKINMLIDPDFKAFLEHLKEKNGTPVSRIIEIATKEKYNKEFEEFLKSREE